jgi:hypothetical protein
MIGEAVGKTLHAGIVLTASCTGKRQVRHHGASLSLHAGRG